MSVVPLVARGNDFIRRSAAARLPDVDTASASDPAVALGAAWRRSIDEMARQSERLRALRKALRRGQISRSAYEEAEGEADRLSRASDDAMRALARQPATSLDGLLWKLTAAANDVLVMNVDGVEEPCLDPADELLLSAHADAVALFGKGGAR